MDKQILKSVRLFAALTIVTGVIYPLLTTAIAQICFPRKANGSVVENCGKVVGVELIAQNFQSDRYFTSRPSAINYNPFPSGASNYGPTSNSLRNLVRDRKRDFIQKNNLPSNTTVPNEMLFASGSGIDPHISPDAAFLQVGRVAHARGFDNRQQAALSDLVRRHIEEPQFVLLGERRVNVLMLNLSLDDLK